SPQIAAIFIGGETVRVTGFLSAPQTRDLKPKGALRRPSDQSGRDLALRADRVCNRGARAVLAPGLATDGALNTVGDRRRSARARELRGEEVTVVVVTQVRHRHAGVAGAVARADVVCVVGLDRRDRSPDV